MKNIFLAVLFLVGAGAGGCALFLTPVLVVGSASEMLPLWLGLSAAAAAAIWISFRLWAGGPRRLWLAWGAVLLAGAIGWVLFITLAFRGFH